MNIVIAADPMERDLFIMICSSWKTSLGKTSRVALRARRA